MADDQDDMAAAWEAEMTGDGGGADDAFAAEWEAMVGAETGKTITASSIGIEPVSYTHLDVYKRQIKDLATAWYAGSVSGSLAPFAAIGWAA